MSDHHTYRKVEIVGSSTTTSEDAINNALAEASKSRDLMEWVEATETRGHIENGKVAPGQGTGKVGLGIPNT
ncbi:dodecin domain-containing protein [Pseudomonas syringae]|nr:dodecin domain-containing protein [Pseudomonas syringae]